MFFFEKPILNKVKGVSLTVVLRVPAKGKMIAVLWTVAAANELS